jgi:hypothetical protein
MTPFDLHGLKTYDLASRPSKVFRNDLGRPLGPGAAVADWLDSLPRQLAADGLRRVRDHVARAYRTGRTVAVALGGHVIKTGCAPYLIDLVRRGVVTSVSMNGSAAIHDFELAFAGKTSEDVAAQLPTGAFGMARETADAFAVAARRGAVNDVGLGAALGRYVDELDCPHADVSLVHAAYRAGIPCTVHVALGTDIVHMHHLASGAAIGDASLRDFRYFVSSVARLTGGVYLNCGSAVVLPEVFLKAVALARNRGIALDGLTTVNLDFVRLYRPQTNVVVRPVAGVGKGYSLVGHHEILIPLIAAALVDSR